MAVRDKSVPPFALLRVRLTPRADRSRVMAWENGVLQVRVAAPPVEGAANQALLELLASTFDIRKSAFTLVGGVTSRDKTVRVDGYDDAALQERGRERLLLPPKEQPA